MAKRKQQGSPVATQHAPTGAGTDWIKVVAVLLLFAGVLNILDGISALVKDDLFDEDKFLFADVATWGWIYIVIGVLQIWAASLVKARHAAGMLMAVTFAAIGGIAHFLSIGAHPVWSLIVMGIDFAVLFVLLTRSDEFA